MLHKLIDIEHMLSTAGASPREAADFAEILYVDLFRGTVDDARTRLNDWRSEKRQMAAQIRESRQRRLDAGYRGLAPSEPVWLGGSVQW